MIDYGLFQFASAPRTGTTWVQHAAVLAGFQETSKAHVHEPFPKERGCVFRVACVRHPCDWLVSYFATIYPGFIAVPAVDLFRTKSDHSDFDRFIRHYLRKFPGAVGRMFLQYGADAYLKVEELPENFCDLMEMLGKPRKSITRCRVLSARNRTIKRKPLWNPQLRRHVIEAEAQFLSDFLYPPE